MQIKFLMLLKVRNGIKKTPGINQMLIYIYLRGGNLYSYILTLNYDNTMS